MTNKFFLIFLLILNIFESKWIIDQKAKDVVYLSKNDSYYTIISNGTKDYKDCQNLVITENNIFFKNKTGYYMNEKKLNGTQDGLDFTESFVKIKNKNNFTFYYNNGTKGEEPFPINNVTNLFEFNQNLIVNNTFVYDNKGTKNNITFTNLIKSLDNEYLLNFDKTNKTINLYDKNLKKNSIKNKYANKTEINNLIQFYNYNNSKYFIDQETETNNNKTSYNYTINYFNTTNNKMEFYKKLELEKNNVKFYLLNNFLIIDNFYLNLTNKTSEFENLEKNVEYSSIEVINKKNNILELTTTTNTTTNTTTIKYLYDLKNKKKFENYKKLKFIKYSNQKNLNINYLIIESEETKKKIKSNKIKLIKKVNKNNIKDDPPVKTYQIIVYNENGEEEKTISNLPNELDLTTKNKEFLIIKNKNYTIYDVANKSKVIYEANSGVNKIIKDLVITKDKKIYYNNKPFFKNSKIKVDDNKFELDYGYSDLLKKINDISNNENEIESYSTEVKNLTNEIDSYSTKVKNLTNEISSLNGHIESYSSDVSSLNNQIGSLKSEKESFENLNSKNKKKSTTFLVVMIVFIVLFVITLVIIFLLKKKMKNNHNEEEEEE